MKKYLIKLFTAILFICLLMQPFSVSAKYEANWESLSKHNETPEWFRDAKFGIYFHWGLYSVPAFGHEWYPSRMYSPYSEKAKEKHRMKTAPKEGQPEYYTKTVSGIEMKYIKGERTKKVERMYINEFHKKNFGDPKEFGYKDFIPLFKAEKFNAEEWAELFFKSGAKFAGPVSEHHDGYSMWDSDVTPFCSGKTGPKKDITGELGKAVKKRGMKFITTFHHAKNRLHFDKNKKKDKEYDLADPKYAKMYGTLPEKEYYQLWKDKLIEVIDKYQPDIIWFDSWLDKIPEKTRQEFAAYYFNQAAKWEKEVVITYKQKDMPMNVGTLDHERGAEKYITPYAWLSDDCVSPHTWSHVEDMEFYPVTRIIYGFVDTVSKNGQLLLNITPKANGEIPEECKKILLEMGEWLKINGEGIYNSRPWITSSEGKYINFTRSKDGKTIYVFTKDWPKQNLEVINLAKDSKFCPWKIKKISMLGNSKSLDFKRDLKSLKITLPKKKKGKHMWGFKIELADLNYADLIKIIDEEMIEKKKHASYGERWKQQTPPKKE